MVYKLILTLILTGIVNHNVDCQVQRVAPGVPPQQYQQVPQHQQQQYQQQQQFQQPQQHQQQFQQMPPQQQQHQQYQQQVPVQQQQHQQQVPVQQQQHQQQVPVQHQQQFQQVPVQQQHPSGHAHDHAHNQFLSVDVGQEKEHIQEHMEIPMDTSKMSEQELQFHYFKMHDSDHNNKLDGGELIKSLIHWHEQGKKTQPPTEEKIFSDDELQNLIDPILNMDDSNNDGYIDYLEFIQAQQKAANNNSPNNA